MMMRLGQKQQKRLAIEASRRMGKFSPKMNKNKN